MSNKPVSSTPVYDAIEKRQTFMPGDRPHAHITWKGTDVYCQCGANLHVDCEFAYYVRCQACGALYQCNPHIELVPVTPEEAASEEIRERSCVVVAFVPDEGGLADGR